MLKHYGLPTISGIKLFSKRANGGLRYELPLFLIASLNQCLHSYPKRRSLPRARQKSKQISILIPMKLPKIALAGAGSNAKFAKGLFQVRNVPCTEDAVPPILESVMIAVENNL